MQPQQQPPQYWPWLLESRPIGGSHPIEQTVGPDTGLTYVAKLAHDAMPTDIETCKRLMAIAHNLDNANMNEALGGNVEEPPPKKSGRRVLPTPLTSTPTRSVS